jgi:predicted DNA-binding helix-hairpin-helix protein
VASTPGVKPTPARAPRFAPGGQSTQMIVGADASSDSTILATSAALYGSYALRRVYFSAFSPIPDAARALPLRAAPLLREHRLYQADWLMRFYGFGHDEITASGDGMLSLEVDPKHAWALAHPERFPVDLNQAPRELLLRVPGLGVRTVDRMLQARRLRKLRCADLKQLHVPLQRVLPFVVLADHRPRGDAQRQPPQQARPAAPVQADMFDGL